MLLHPNQPIGHVNDSGRPGGPSEAGSAWRAALRFPPATERQLPGLSASRGFSVDTCKAGRGHPDTSRGKSGPCSRALVTTLCFFPPLQIKENLKLPGPKDALDHMGCSRGCVSSASGQNLRVHEVSG
ncbi:hypothetical protein J1605_009445 [Eschrichtius robustus]|uniref:Uncharacterized protein n=1 Tax=Eschrichtius robustus TaxID=9764 RepID=A0AB34GQQ0_ESCRO|nr:hypothetical protein J1605_009445 [Eschrichtius robustus]